MAHKTNEVAIIGGGAAGFFAAIACAENGDCRVTIFEEQSAPLRKVRLSGGGRCNLTHSCFDPQELASYYPRGGTELLGPFSIFQPSDTIKWFSSRQVELNTESDGRVFPASNSSETIINCLTSSATQAGVNWACSKKAVKIEKSGDFFNLVFHDGETARFDQVLIASGGGRQKAQLAQTLGHTVTNCVPSLFSFKIDSTKLLELPGLSVTDAAVQLLTGSKTFRSPGALLITHSGLSGPAIIRLSSLAAPELAAENYKADLLINWLGSAAEVDVLKAWKENRGALSNCLLTKHCPFAIPKGLWCALTAAAGIPVQTKWCELSKDKSQALLQELLYCKIKLVGRGEHKREMVTCGGILRKEINFKTMESRLCPGLFFAGEVIDIDGLTGGFNLQNAWTTGFIAGISMGAKSIAL